jgi:hypothetical protein
MITGGEPESQDEPPLAEPDARSVQEICDQGRGVTFTWLDPVPARTAAL